jgi:predicted metalloprotease with PDZ domain
VLKDDGVVLDAIPGTPAGKAGVAPGAKIVAVNGRRFSGDVVRDAVKTTKQRELELIVESGDYFRTYKVSYRGGARYPMLERIAGKADLVGEILKGRVGSP